MSWPGLSHGCPVQQESLFLRDNIKELELPGVLAGLVPAIHAAPLQTNFYAGGGFGAWMPGTRPRLSGSAKPVVNFKSHTTPARRARACPGHPRRAEAANFESFLQRHGVDGRDKPGLDAERF